MNGLVAAPAERDRWHKLFKFAPLVMILLYMRTRPEKPVTQIGLSEEFGIDRKTAAACLRELAGYGMVVHVDHNNGYSLGEGGQQMLLDLDAGWGKNGHLPLKESLKDLKDLKIKDKKEGKKQMGIFWTAPEWLTTEKILSETGKLFGFETVSHGVQGCDPSLTMALIAHAYDQRLRLAKPQIFVYRRMQRNDPPDKKYLIDPLQYLPNSFLHALGLAALDVVEESPVDLEELAATADPDSEEVRAWEQVLATLKAEMPKASFETWARDTQVLRVDGQVLIVCARNQYACDWLTSRLQARVDQLVADIFAGMKQVKFCVATETEE